MNNINEQNRNAYNFLAETYTKAWADKPDIELAECFVEYLPKNAHILDVGCGPGHYSMYFFSKGYAVEGVDFSESMIDIATRRYPNIVFSRQDMYRLKYEDATFDALWICSSFVHIPKIDVQKVLKELKRVMKNSGVLFINAIVGDLDFRLESQEELGSEYLDAGRFFQWYPSVGSFEEVLASAGLIIRMRKENYITSEVVEKAKLKTNYWVNFICELNKC
jgi:ubiquinone/menaquinone biosynthesis C-methylase UbiE